MLVLIFFNQILNEGQLLKVLKEKLTNEKLEILHKKMKERWGENFEPVYPNKVGDLIENCLECSCEIEYSRAHPDPNNPVSFDNFQQIECPHCGAINVPCRHCEHLFGDPCVVFCPLYLLD